ncbi:MAG: hypothetical protein RLZZ15_1113 [Verrucomicrobiota bacterium]
MNFAAWRELEPLAAARELHRRARALLAPAQARAVVAHLAAEEEIAARLAAGRAGPLGGVPYFAKDLFDVAGLPTFAGSTFLPELRPPTTADGNFVRAVGACGAALAGKTHMHEFAYGITGENPHYGDCEHPRFPGRTTGGSSSGSAAAVAAGVVPLALGCDTGGSVRVPAAWCGLYGFRLTPGDAWIRDAFPLAPSFDTAGWFTENAADLRETIGALVGLRGSERAPRGCVLELPGLDAEVSEAFRAAAARFAEPAAGDARRDLLNGFAGAADAYNTITAVEAWHVHRGWAEKFRERYGPVVWQRLNRFATITPAQIDAAHLALQANRALWAAYFLTWDFLVLPASPCAAPTKAECTLGTRSRVLALTAPASLGGLPVVTIPVALPSGLTTGLQIVVSDPQSPVVNWALARCAELKL